MILYIAEKPEVAKAIAACLSSSPKPNNGYIDCGNNQIVSWCIGHLLTFKMPEELNPAFKQWALHLLPMQLQPLQLKPISKTAPQLKTLLSLIKRATKIFHAGDIDAQGQLLVDEVILYANFSGLVERVLINDLNTKSVQRALANTKPNTEFRKLYESAYGRAVFDFVYGMNLSRVCTVLAKKNNAQSTVLSVGRVQTAILSLVVERCRLNESHTSIPFYENYAALTFDNHTIEFKISLDEHYIADNQENFDDKNRLLNQQLASDIKQALLSQTISISQIDKKDKTASPPLPFALLDLQKTCSNMFGFDPDRTLKITQSLRENRKLISYNRTDCSYLPEEYFNLAPGIISSIVANCPQFSGAASAADLTIKSRAFNDSKITAHHGIIPVESRCDMKSLSDDELKVYMLISRAFIAQFFPKKITSEIRAMASLGSVQMSAFATNVVDYGWEALYSGETSDDSDDSDDIEKVVDKYYELSNLKKYDNAQITDTYIETKTTKPKPLYTMATLLEDLKRAAIYVKNPALKQVLIERDKGSQERGGIGTPATRSEVIKTLFNREFIQYNKKNVIATPKGAEFYSQLPDYVTSVDLTALWQLKMNQVESSEISLDDFLTEVDRFVFRSVERIKATGISVGQATATTAVKIEHHCHKCQKPLRLIKPKGKTAFWGCHGYPECKSIYKNVNGKPKTDDRSSNRNKDITEFCCLQCNSSLIRNVSKNGIWYGCSGFPECKTTYFDSNGQPKY